MDEADRHRLAIQDGCSGLPRARGSGAATTAPDRTAGPWRRRRACRARRWPERAGTAAFRAASLRAARLWTIDMTEVRSSPAAVIAAGWAERPPPPLQPVSAAPSRP